MIYGAGSAIFGEKVPDCDIFAIVKGVPANSTDEKWRARQESNLWPQD
jgi:hypothetical protein